MRSHLRRDGSSESSAAAQTNYRVVLSERDYLSGASVQFEALDLDGAMLVELRRIDSDDELPLRVATIDLAKVEPGEAEHVYWEPVVAAERRFFFLSIRVVDGTREVGSSLPMLHTVKLVYSPPQAYAPLPRALLFSPISQCNLNCTHCISRSTRARLRFASEPVWNAVRTVVHGEKFVHLATDYSGDILFDEKRYPGTLKRIIALDADFRIDTNANCLDEDIVQMLLASRLFEINFSIDSMDPEVYRRIRRGSLPLAQVLAKIGRFMARKREAAKRIHTIISFVLMRSNAATIKSALAFARENGIDHVNVFPLLAFTPDMVDEIFVWDESAYSALYDELTNEAARLGVALAMQAPVKRWRDDDIHAPCEVPWGSAAIMANGDVMACCMPGTVIGNLHRQSLDEIWNGAAFRAFRRRVNSPDPPASCRNCGMARVHNNRKAYAPVRYGVSPVES